MGRDDSFYHVGGGTMKKYNTKPIDFTGCHPVIAEALKRGEAIECEVWDFREKPPAYDCGMAWIDSYHHGASHPYADTYDTLWKHAEPIPLKTRRIMPPERAIPVLIANGWEYNKEGALVGDPPIVPQMFQEMGGPIDNSRAVWPPCIIEEVKDDE